MSGECRAAYPRSATARRIELAGVGREREAGGWALGSPLRNTQPSRKLFYFFIFYGKRSYDVHDASV
jgi:hypothetical protein